MTTATLTRAPLDPTVRAVRPAVRPAARPVAARSAGVRLTARGRAVLLVLVALVSFAAVLLGAVSVSAGGSAPSAAVTERVVVQPGQTLWEFAEQVAPSADPRETVRRIKDLNGLEGSVVVPGQALVVPAAV
jgi:LysM repeat protein